MKYLIACLGNIGPEYLLTRHNVGFLVADRLAGTYETKFSMERLAYHAEIKHKGRQIHLIKPTTYMNLSGKAVNYWMKDLKIETENILIVTDDIALPYGKLRLKPKGSHGGHNGLRNIEEVLGGNSYARLRFGVGDEFAKGRQVEYVLGNFEGAEYEQLPEYLDRAGEMILSFCTQGIQPTMNKFNQ
ncbi:peptidyl-tRNA hydrolase [Pseudarcicella hirudinis]|uniref:Peptidyl-tRNA hydrolase n=1 Tax=Pseudarcicella hirudinis TaxID=1079859 RepID=A0A1I5PL29_9BACT|nr:aminoacyl-tRNA hydrolase [Pseudarcicella hirudinis]SFP34729.1 peptidyl-tRNA hydrolase [Pseudarcicella hirudinis]